VAEGPAELSSAQVEQLHHNLVALEKQLRAALEGSTEGAKPVDLDQPIGRLSRMDAIQQKEMACASRATQLARLRQVAGAMARIRGGDYGLCAGCEEPIGFKRLSARPEAPLCLRCQSARE
jgi:DnaK suppressor protein